MKHIIVTVLLLCLAFQGFAQKVKYKDLFILLKAENYQDGEDYLRKFLATNPEHPHANYSMGKMLQFYMQKQNVLTEKKVLIALADSAIMFYDNALNYITEKNVKKHDDDYYAEFKRRNLRSGKFEVKISDVQLDVENRKKEIKEFMESVKTLNRHFDVGRSFYDSCRLIYKNFTTSAPSLNELYFTTGAHELERLRDLEKLYDSAKYHLNIYRSIRKELAPTKEVQAVIEKAIEQYLHDGINEPNFYGKEIELWNYKLWAKSMVDFIGRRIYPLKKRMVAYDLKLEQLHDKIISDSLDERSDIFRLATENVGRDLRDYDNTSLPAAIYNYRIAEINYHSTVNYWYLEVQDTSNIGLKLDALLNLKNQLSSLGKLIVKLEDANNEKEQRIFKDFINERYDGKIGFAAFLKEQVSFVHMDSVQLEAWKTIVLEQDKVALWKTDSISLIVGNQSINGDSIKYSTFMIDSLSERAVEFYAWQEKNDSLFFAFGIAPSSRSLDTLFTVSAMAGLFDNGMMGGYLTDSINHAERVWVFTNSKNNKGNYSAQIILTDARRGVTWTTTTKLTENPVSLKYDPELEEFFLYNDKEKPIITIDKGGAIVETPQD